MSIGYLHQNAPRSPWPRRLVILGRNTVTGFAAVVTAVVTAAIWAGIDQRHGVRS